MLQPVERIDPGQVPCPRCGVERVPGFVHSLADGGAALGASARQTGLPPWDILWARYGSQTLGIELAGDNPWPESLG
jgi:hypothetical protein